MLLNIDLTSELPIYQQIRDQVVQAIATGQLVEGSGLPSTRQLAVDLGVNFHTVNKGYDLLRQEGLLRLNRRSGAVVMRDPESGEPEAGFLDAWSTRLRIVLAEAVAHGIDHETVLRICQDVLRSFGASRADLQRGAA
jgi:GntR family transcriptional regulator